MSDRDPKDIELGRIERDFIESLKENEPVEESRFKSLKKMHRSNPVKDNRVILKAENRVEYNRMADIYLQNRYNKFFVPVWTSAFNDKTSTGYVMYPKLIPVKQMLTEINSNDQLSDSDIRGKLSDAVRLSVAPIALAVDALHTPILNRRTSYHHRDICIDKAFVSSLTDENGTTIYGEAMLRLTKNTRVSHGSMFLEQKHSIGQSRMNEKYFHHPEPYEDPTSGSHYHRRHDWFSVGVYILEVLGIALKSELTYVEQSQSDKYDQSGPKIGFKRYSSECNDDEDKVKHYLHFAQCLMDALSNLPEGMFSDTLAVGTYKAYIEEAKKYIANTSFSAEQLMTYQFNTHETDHKYLEYGLYAETAELLHWFQNHPKDYRSMQQVQLEQSRATPDLATTCQACLLRFAVPLPMGAYRQGADRRSDRKSDNKCDETCDKFYCVQCYMNGERLFCPMKHGTASKIFGHNFSFALILYGKRSAELKNAYECNADELYNTLTHHMVIGIPEDNVLKRAIYDETCEKNAGQCLQEVCDEMNSLIHIQHGNDKCDADYCLYICYIGHGARDGIWCATERKEDHIQPDQVAKCLNSLAKHKGVERLNSRVGMVFIMDHCYPPYRGKEARIAQNMDENGKAAPLSRLSITAKYGKPAKCSHDSGISRIMEWICNLLRSVVADTCKKGDCPNCKDMTDRLRTKCSNTFIDGKTIEIHKLHMRDTAEIDVDFNVTGFSTALFMLALYNPNGIYNRVLPFDKELKDVDVSFRQRMDYDNVKEDVLRIVQTEQMEQKEQNIQTAKKISLLMSNDSEHSRYNLVWESDFRSNLERASASAPKTSPSQIYYKIVKNPVKTNLCGGGDGSVSDELDVLDVDESNMDDLVKFQPDPFAL